MKKVNEILIQFKRMGNFNIEWRYLIALLLLLLIVFTVAKTIEIWQNVPLDSAIEEKHPVISGIPLGTVTKIIAPTAKLTPTPEPKFMIKRQTTTAQEKIFEFGHDDGNAIIRWQESLLFAYLYGQNGKLAIYQHDLTTGKTTVVFSKKSDELGISDLTIINDTLYFSLGAYLRAGESYWIDLNSNDRVAHALTDTSGAIKKIKNRYFFIKSEGDACWGKSDFSLLDIKTKALTPVAQTRIGCGGGEEYLGINNNDQMILSNHANFPDSDGYDWPVPTLYTSLIVIHLTAPQVKKEVLSVDLMPKKVSNIIYNEENDVVLLIGDAVYTYSFAQNQLQKIIDFPDEWLAYKKITVLSRLDENNYCIEKSKDAGQNLSYVFNIEKKTLLKKSISCTPWEPYDVEKERVKIEKIFKDLVLPSHYSLIRE